MTLGYIVLAKRPDIRNEGAFTHDVVSSVWPTVEPCENHQAYCQLKAEAEPERYGDVEYVIAEMHLYRPPAPALPLGIDALGTIAC